MNSKENKFFSIIHTTGVIGGTIISFIIAVLAKSVKVTDNTFIWDFDWSILGSFSFWIIALAVDVAIVFVYFGFYILVRDRKLESAEFQQELKDYNDIIKSKEENFVEYIDHNNDDERVRCYVNETKDKIGELKLKYNNLDINKRALIGKDILDQIEFLKSTLTPEYLEENKDYLKSNYEHIYAQSFTKATWDANVSDRKIESNESKIMTRKGITKVITGLAFSVLITILFTYIAFTFDVSAAFWIYLLSTVMSCIWQAYVGMQTALKNFRCEIEAPILNKTAIMHKYIKWLENHPTDTMLEIERKKITKEIQEKADMEVKEYKKQVLEEIKEISNQVN